MDESSQSNHSYAMSNSEIIDALVASVYIDKHLMRTLVSIQFNNLNVAYANIEAVLKTIDYDKALELNSSALFAVQETANIIDSAFGDDGDSTPDPREEV